MGYEFLPAQVHKFIGGIIVVIIIMLLFLTFSSPFLDYMSNQENIRGFNKITTGFSTACIEGVSTQTYISLTGSSNTNFFMTIVGNETATYLRSFDEKLIDSSSKRSLSRCIDGDLCFCLFKTVDGQTSLSKSEKAIVKKADLEPKETNISYYKNTEITAYSYLYGTDKLAQEFLPDRGGNVKEIWVMAGPESATSSYSTTLSVSIYADYPYSQEGGPIPDLKKLIATAEVSPDILKTHSMGDWLKVEFDDDVFVSEKQTYFIVLESSKEIPFYEFLYWEGKETKDDVYDESLGAGDAFYYDGSTWTKISDFDVFGFVVIADPLTPEQLLEEWDQQIKTNLGVSGFGYFEVLQCRALIKDLGCIDENNDIIPLMIKTEGEYYVITTLKSTDETLWFDSYSFNRPITSSGQFKPYVLSHTEPEVHDYMHKYSGEESVLTSYSLIGELESAPHHT